MVGGKERDEDPGVGETDVAADGVDGCKLEADCEYDAVSISRERYKMVLSE